MSAPDPWALLERANARANDLATELGRAHGHMMNARIDLESGETKAKAIATLTRGIDFIRAFNDRITK